MNYSILHTDRLENSNPEYLHRQKYPLDTHVQFLIGLQLQDQTLNQFGVK